MHNIKCRGCLSTHTLSKVSSLKVSKSKFSPKVLKWEYLSENDTFESVILENVTIESVRVDRHPHMYIHLGTYRIRQKRHAYIEY